jgi:hypothetical protein
MDTTEDKDIFPEHFQSHLELFSTGICTFGYDQCGVDRPLTYLPPLGTAAESHARYAVVAASEVG